MTPNELMNRRFKVIAPYPHSPYQVGDLVEMGVQSFHITTTRDDSYLNESGKCENYFSIAEVEKYPHLFREMPWYEDRKVEDMPEYVKDKISGKIFNPVHFSNHWAYPSKNGCAFGGRHIRYETLLPATQEEYEQFKAKNK